VILEGRAQTPPVSQTCSAEPPGRLMTSSHGEQERAAAAEMIERPLADDSAAMGR